jgi:hypothetical protein
MTRQIVLIALGILCAGVARAEMPRELVEMLARAEVPATARAEIRRAEPRCGCSNATPEPSRSRWPES